MVLEPWWDIARYCIDWLGVVFPALHSWQNLWRLSDSQLQAFTPYQSHIIKRGDSVTASRTLTKSIDWVRFIIILFLFTIKSHVFGIAHCYVHHGLANIIKRYSIKTWHFQKHPSSQFFPFPHITSCLSPSSFQQTFLFHTDMLISTHRARSSSE